ncbi:MAG TPA: hemolysin family protein [Acidimicrobiia bacterium]|nr:hemolysin family protein [Acidimicrobiia bacterium]
MDNPALQFTLIGILILINAAFAGTEIALISLREGQLNRLEESGGAGRVLARLARDPNRFLATIQIAITLSGFLASAYAAVSLADPVSRQLDFLGNAAVPVSIVVVTLGISFMSLVFGELAPKRLAMQSAERWGLVTARPLTVLASIASPIVWLLSKATNIVVRLLGGDPDLQGEALTEQELRDLMSTQTTFSLLQREIISGAFDISERRLRELLVPRRDVLVLDTSLSAEEALATLLESGHSRAPVAPEGNLDLSTGIVHLRDLIGAAGALEDLAGPPTVFPETAKALDVLREMQHARQHLAIVVSEHGSGEGIITIEDLIEELVGEIYDESDKDLIRVERLPDGSLELPGNFPMHDLVDLGVTLPEGEYTTVAGAVLDSLGRVPEEPGDVVDIDGWQLRVLAVEDRAITRVRLRRLDEPADKSSEPPR